MVSSTNLPPESLLHKRMAPVDFLDCYFIPCEMSPRRAADIITDFPKWAKFLLIIRRAITAPFGISNDGPGDPNSVGIFPVEYESEQELIAGFNDKHLNFRVSVMSKQGQVYLATWVHTHNFWGKLYLMVILPFHILIARNGLVRVKAQEMNG